MRRKTRIMGHGGGESQIVLDNASPVVLLLPPSWSMNILINIT